MYLAPCFMMGKSEPAWPERKDASRGPPRKNTTKILNLAN